eukprot:EC790900.1.p3 GENE.EC790900.1~~EC790900.1.p3  ORF type:complete len:75 (+),score=5.54 EC790900.1:290-514(+)
MTTSCTRGLLCRPRRRRGYIKRCTSAACRFCARAVRYIRVVDEDMRITLPQQCLLHSTGVGLPERWLWNELESL